MNNYTGLLIALVLANQSIAGLTPKIFLSEAKGESTITSDGKVFTPEQSSTFDAPRAVLETKPESHQSLVYSNGTGVFVDEDTRLEVRSFEQADFRADRDLTSDDEPSSSRSEIFLSRGQVVICTGRLASGSTMNYSTPNAAVSIRGGRIAIRSEGEVSTVFLMDGDATVKAGPSDLNGIRLRPGEQAAVTRGSVVVVPLDRSSLNSLQDMSDSACRARNSAIFDVVNNLGAAGSSTQEIVAQPVVPSSSPLNIVISPDRISTK